MAAPRVRRGRRRAIDLAVHVSGEAFLTPPGPLSQIMARAVEKVTGLKPELSTTGGTSDARFIKDYCPVAEFGLVGQTMHKVDERVPVSDLLALTEIYEAVLDGYFARPALMQLLIDLVRAVKGLSRLFRFDASYAGYFDKSIQGTWRSFFAMMLLAPIVALGMPDDLNKTYPNASEFEYLAVSTCFMSSAGSPSPVAMLEIGRWLKRSEAMPSYITVYNWFQLIHLPFSHRDLGFGCSRRRAMRIGGLLCLDEYRRLFHLSLLPLAFVSAPGESHGRRCSSSPIIAIFLIAAAGRTHGAAHRKSAL